MFGAMAGGFIGAIGLCIVLALKLWPGVKRLLGMTKRVADDFDEALGAPDVDERGDRSLRRKTGSFQSVVRTELGASLKPIERKVEGLGAELHRKVDDLRLEVHEIHKAQTDLTKGQGRQAELVSDLARTIDRVAARAAENSARLNVARADESTAKGRVRGD